jgi:hypothetical protein
MQNLNLTWAQDLGSVTELLSGDFFQPLGRSSSHQMWSSAMVIAPLLRGLFGIDWNAITRTLRVAPSLPADWDRARVRHLMLGSTEVDLDMERSGTKLIVRATSGKPIVLCLNSACSRTSVNTVAAVHTTEIPLKPVELSVPAVLPGPGSRTSQLKVLNEESAERSAVFLMAAPGGTEYDLLVRLNRPGIRASGGQLTGNKLHIQFPSGAGYQNKTISFSW